MDSEAIRQFKEIKAAGIIEAPRALTKTLGSMEAAALVFEVMRGVLGGGEYCLGDKEFAARLSLPYETFRHLRRKLEGERIISHVIRQVSGKTVPHYSLDWERLKMEQERVNSGGVPLFTKGKHYGAQKAQISQSQDSKEVGEISQSESPKFHSPPNFHSPNETKDLPIFHTPKAQISQTQENNGFSHFSQSLPVSPVINTPGTNKSPASIWKEIMGLSLPPGAEEVINNRVSNREAWRETLIGWKANPKWNDANFDGQISRYTKKLRDGDFGSATPPAQETSAPNPEEDARRERERKSLYGDQ